MLTPLPKGVGAHGEYSNLLRTETNRENGVGVARRPDSAGHKTVQFWEVALRDRFPPVEQALGPAQIVAESLKVVSVKHNIRLSLIQTFRIENLESCTNVTLFSRKYQFA